MVSASTLKRVGVIVVLALGLSASVACRRTVAPGGSASADTALVEAALSGRSYVSECAAEDSFRHLVLELVRQERFDLLEKLAARLRHTPENFGSLRNKRHLFFDAFRRHSMEQNSRDLFRRLERWERAFPRSSTAALAWAHLEMGDLILELLNAGHAPSRADLSQWVQACVARARTAVDWASANDPSDVEPVALSYELLALGGGTPSHAAEDLARAIRLEPLDMRPCVASAWAVLGPQTGGAGPWEPMAARAADLTRALLGDGMYTAVVWHMNWQQQTNYYRKGIASWPRARQGWLDLLHRYPQSTLLPGVFIQHAYNNRDRSLVRALLARLGDTYHCEIWSGLQQIEVVRKWANQAPADADASSTSGPDLTFLKPAQTIPLGCERDVAGLDRWGEQQFGTAVRHLFKHEQFAALEEIATRLRHEPAQRLGAASLRGFYDALDPNQGNQLEVSAWEAALGRCDRWLTAFPQSVTARLVGARVYVGYGWSARGGGYADSVSAEGWRLFRERLARARGLLEDAEKSAERDPEAYRLLLSVFRGEGGGRGEFQTLLDRANRAFPDDISIDEAAAPTTLERWGGAPGDLDALARRAAQRTQQKRGWSAYAEIASTVAGYAWERNFLEQAGLDWPSIKRGFEDALKRDPDNRGLLLRYLYMACLTRERGTARDLFGRVGSNWDYRDWGHPWLLEEARAWATGSGDSPGSRPMTAEIADFGLYTPGNRSGVLRRRGGSIPLQVGTTFGYVGRLHNPSRQRGRDGAYRPVRLTMVASTQHSDGSTYQGYCVDGSWVYPDNPDFYVLHTFNRDDTARWPPGAWTVSLQCDGRTVASRRFILSAAQGR